MHGYILLFAYVILRSFVDYALYKKGPIRLPLSELKQFFSIFRQCVCVQRKREMCRQPRTRINNWNFTLGSNVEESQTFIR